MSHSSLPPSNPVLNAYETFTRETPLVTRYVLLSQLGTWVLSLFVDFSYAVANVPHFTIFRFELYRIFLSPLFCSSLMTLLFAFVSFLETGRRLEFGMGSAGLACFLFTIGILTNLAHLAVCFLLYGMTRSQVWLFLPSIGIWTALFGVIAVECSGLPPTSTRRLFVVTIPTLYYPIALVGLFCLLGGFQLPYIISVGVGYAYGHGYLDRLKVSTSRLKRWEDTLFQNIARREGWVVSSEAIGVGEWNEASQGSPNGVLGLFSRLTNQQQGRRSENNASFGEGHVQEMGTSTMPSFPEGGRQLGTASKRTAAIDPRQARLEAIERRSREASNDERV